MRRRSFLMLMAAASLAPSAAFHRVAVAQGGNRPPPRPLTTPPGRWEVFAGGYAGPGELISESGVAIDAAGTIYVGDPPNNRIVLFTADGTPSGSFPIWPGWVGRISPIQDMAITPGGEILALFANPMEFEGQGGYFGVRYANGGRPLGQFGPQGEPPHGLGRPTALDSGLNGEAWVVDSQRNVLLAYGRDGRWLRSLGGAGTEPGQFKNPLGVAVAPNGTLWVTDAGNNRVQTLTQAGAPVNVWDTVGAEWGQFSGVRRIRVGRDGNVVVSESEREYSSRTGSAPPNRRIQKLRPDGTPLASAWLYEVTALAIGPDGSVVTISRSVPSGVRQFSPALDPQGPIGSHPGYSERVQTDRLMEPSGVTFDRQGNVYVADGKQAAVFVYAPDGVLLTRWGTRGDEFGQFRGPSDILIGPGDTIFVSDAALDRIYTFSLDGQLLDVWGGAGSGPGRLYSPQAMALDAQGNLYVADSQNGRVQKFGPSGESRGISQNRTGRSFKTANGVAVDAHRRIYVCDGEQGTVFRLTPDGQFDRTVATFQSELSGIVIDSSGSLWVTEYRGGRVWKLDQDGQIIGGWGSLTTSDPLIESPTDIAVDPSGRVYVTTTRYGRVWRFTPEGVQ